MEGPEGLCVAVPVPGSPPGRATLVLEPNGARWFVSVRLQFEQVAIELSDEPPSIDGIYAEEIDYAAECASVAEADKPAFAAQFKERMMQDRGEIVLAYWESAQIRSQGTTAHFDRANFVQTRDGRMLLSAENAQRVELPLSADEYRELPQIFAALAPMGY